MSDIVLVYPKTGFDIKGVSIDPPLSLLAIASTVIDKYSVKIIDQRMNDNWQHALINELKFNPLCVGITSMTGPQIKYALEATRIVKSVKPDMKVVWGGVHATLLPEQTLAYELIDIIVIGEGEVTFKELVDSLKEQKELKNIRGIAFKNNGSIFITEARDYLDLNALPEIPYNLVNIEDYIGSQGRFRGINMRSLIFISSRGCPWGCTYCCNPRLSKRKWRALSAEETFKRVSNLVKKYQLNAITFHDEEFLVDQKRAEEIAGLIRGEFKWWIQARMDRLKDSHLEFLNDSGLVAVQPGIESGSDRILKMIKKGETVSDILIANKILVETDIIPLYNFMMGFPTETYKELMQTVDLALQLLKDNPKAQVSGFYTCIPYPGTELFELAKYEGFQVPSTLEEWAKYNRQHLETPWIKNKINVFKSLMVASKFIDGSRLKHRLDEAFGGIDSPDWPYKLLAKFYRYCWRKRIFGTPFDKFFNKIALMFFNISHGKFFKKKLENFRRKNRQSSRRIVKNRYERYKSYFDFIIAFILFIILSPIFFLASIFIKLTSKGPIFYTDKAVGQNGKVFVVYKFRTMKYKCDTIIHKEFIKNYIKNNKEFSVDNNGMKLFKLLNDPRVTKIGKILRKTSIDELPQLINVLKREMSLVGPRAPLVSEYKIYTKWYKKRVAVKSGITGYHQITGRGRDPFKKMFQKDLFYIKNQSFILDLWIMAKTILVVISCRGAH